MKQPPLFSDDKPKRKKPVLLTRRSRKFLERQGFIVALVERSLDVPKFKENPAGERFRNKFDCFGIADLCCCHSDQVGCLFVQVTDFAHAAEHRDKILAAKALPILLTAQNRVELHCWKSCKRKGRKMWQLRMYALFRTPQSIEWAEAKADHWFLDNMQEIEADF
jgi:hypothetical protein